MDNETFEALKRVIFTLHKTPVQGINGLDFVKVRDWIDKEQGKAHGDFICSKYNQKVLPDEEGNCSLCGARLDRKLNKKSYFQIIDLQGAGIHEAEYYETKEEIRQHLIAYHSIDWEAEDGDINQKTLEFLLDYGTWQIEEVEAE